MSDQAVRPTPSQRAGRILRWPLVRGALGFVWLLFALVAAQLAVMALPAADSGVGRLVGALIIVAVSLLAYVAFVRVVERRRPSELALTGALPELAAGVLLGAVLFTLAIGLIWLLGFYTVTGTHPLTVLLAPLALSLMSGVTEELLFRGIVFRIVEEGLGSGWALVLSALFFGLLHLANPNASLLAGLAIAIEAGLLLAAAYMLTRRLWLAIGVHFAWNFVQGGVFGVAVSGNTVQGLLQSTLSGPALLSGGAFGVEASLFAVLACVGAAAYMLWRVRQRGGWVAPFWARQGTA
jgi:membrane protease YdiL (CAAX protease family)